jgi:hypothetical protein
MSDARYGVAAAALSRAGYQDAGLNYATCDLVAAPLQQTSAASAQTLTLPTGHLADVPVVAAGGSLALVLWREASTGGASGRTGWFASSSVSGGALSSPARFGPSTPNVSAPALVIDSSGRATVAVMASLTSLPSLQRIYVANYSVPSGWSEWRQVFAGFSARALSLAVNDAGDTVLAFSATPCDRTPAVPEPACSIRKTAAIFVIRNP